MITSLDQPTRIFTCQGAFPCFDRPIPKDWVHMARQKNFTAVARICDRYHLALACESCGATNKVKTYTLRSGQPQCRNCQDISREEKARAVGATYLGRDQDDPHYLRLRLDCGHEVSRQTGLLDRVARGEVDIRCETCLRAREEAEAMAQGWTRLGIDPEGDPNYRLYRHDACGTDQRIARANMQSGRFSCRGCGKDWPAAPSNIYLMAFTLASGRQVVKLGYSLNPHSRLHHQLVTDKAMACAILTSIPMSSGHLAILNEKALHKKIRSRFPDAVVDPSEWQGQINIQSEIYDARIAADILEMLKALSDAELN